MDDGKRPHLDRLFWLPGWKNLSTSERISLIEESASGIRPSRRSTGELISNVQKIKPTDTQGIAASQLELINRYHHNVLKQAQQSFFWALIASPLRHIFAFCHYNYFSTDTDS